MDTISFGYHITDNSPCQYLNLSFFVNAIVIKGIFYSWFLAPSFYPFLTNCLRKKTGLIVDLSHKIPYIIFSTWTHNGFLTVDDPCARGSTKRNRD